jgi:hypothetical protein
MPVRLKKPEVAKLAPEFERRLLDGQTKQDICKEMNVFMGALNMYLRIHANAHICELALTNGRGD